MKQRRQLQQRRSWSVEEELEVVQMEMQRLSNCHLFEWFSAIPSGRHSGPKPWPTISCIIIQCHWAGTQLEITADHWIRELERWSLMGVGTWCLYVLHWSVVQSPACP